MFPNLNNPQVQRRYYEQRAARVLLFDGETTFYTLAYKHRRLRFATIFWCRPRLYRVNAGTLLTLRGYNVTAANRRDKKLRQKQGRRVCAWHRQSRLLSQTGKWF